MLFFSLTALLLRVSLARIFVIKSEKDIYPLQIGSTRWDESGRQGIVRFCPLPLKNHRRPVYKKKTACTHCGSSCHTAEG